VTGFTLSFSDHVSSPDDYKLRVPERFLSGRSKEGIIPDIFHDITSKLHEITSDIKDVVSDIVPSRVEGIINTVLSGAESVAHKITDSFVKWVEEFGHIEGSAGLPRVNITFDQPRHHLLKRL